MNTDISLLVAFGFAYFIYGLKAAYRHREHRHPHGHDNEHDHERGHGHAHLHAHSHEGGHLLAGFSILLCGLAILFLGI